MHSGKLDLIEAVRVYEATSTIGESTEEAVAKAQSWLGRQKEETQEDDQPAQS